MASDRVEATYPPLDTLKPVADGLWIVDSGPMQVAGAPLPVRMTVAKLTNGDVWLHSPTRFIRSLRDDAGFSLAQIGQLLEDEAARERNRLRFRTTGDKTERRALLNDATTRVDRQIDTLEAKRARLDAMIADARARRRHLDEHIANLDGGPDPHPGHGPHPARESRR